MAKKRTPSRSKTKAISADRAARLHRLLTLLSQGPQSRAELSRRLRLDVRGFYRDLEILRAHGIHLALVNKRYTLKEKGRDAIDRLPFPDPHLTLAEARQLANGRSPAHRKLKAQIARIIR